MLRYQAIVAAHALCLGLLLGACASEHSGKGPEHDSDRVDAVDGGSIDDDEASSIDAEAALDAADLMPADAQPPDAPQADAQQPDAQPKAAAAPQLDGGTFPMCEEQISEHAFALDTADCAQRPASPCVGEQDGDPRPGKFVAKQAFDTCNPKDAFYMVGVTLDAQGCPNALDTYPFPASDPQVMCMRKLLQTQRYPCAFRCSSHFGGLWSHRSTLRDDGAQLLQQLLGFGLM